MRTPIEEISKDRAQSIIVFVRLGPNENEHMRHLTFKIPDRIPQKDLLEKGFAIDGNQALVEIARHNDEQRGFPYGSTIASGFDTLAGALHSNQVALVEFLEKYGFEVNFK